MPRIDIDRIAPTMERISEDGELVAELFRHDDAFEEAPAFYAVGFTEDPRGAKRIYARDRLVDTALWDLDAHPLA